MKSVLDLLERICGDPVFQLTRSEVETILVPARFTGRSGRQVEEFLASCIEPLLAENRDLLGENAELSV